MHSKYQLLSYRIVVLYSRDPSKQNGIAKIFSLKSPYKYFKNNALWKSLGGYI